ncbi:hypothetical protein VTI74DRAFT_7359 [Chaetomium olivicolor]
MSGESGDKRLLSCRISVSRASVPLGLRRRGALARGDQRRDLQNLTGTDSGFEEGKRGLKSEVWTKASLNVIARRVVLGYNRVPPSPRGGQCGP